MNLSKQEQRKHRSCKYDLFISRQTLVEGIVTGADWLRGIWGEIELSISCPGGSIAAQLLDFISSIEALLVVRSIVTGGRVLKCGIPWCTLVGGKLYFLSNVFSALAALPPLLTFYTFR